MHCSRHRPSSIADDVIVGGIIGGLSGFIGGVAAAIDITHNSAIDLRIIGAIIMGSACGGIGVPLGGIIGGINSFRKPSPPLYTCTMASDKVEIYTEIVKDELERSLINH